MSRFRRFFDALASVQVSERAVNQYARGGPEAKANAIRRDNLRLYFEQLEAVGPRMLLIGEAPSHRGGRLTGIPFVSESVMLSGVALGNGGVALGEANGFRRATSGSRRSTEASCTMVWGTIRHIEPLPLLWNAFPFHPFREGTPTSNRMPTAAELAHGRPFIERLLTLFPIEQVVAVGNHASASLTRLGIAHEKVRHPSMAGKPQFVAGMARLARSSQITSA